MYAPAFHVLIASCNPTMCSITINSFNVDRSYPLVSRPRVQVACGPCSAYAGHLYERLGAELGVSDGMTMKSDFCNGMVEACAGQIAFPTYDGGSTSYCQKHVGDSDLIWSYPIDESGNGSGQGPAVVMRQVCQDAYQSRDNVRRSRV